MSNFSVNWGMGGSGRREEHVIGNATSWYIDEDITALQINKTWQQVRVKPKWAEKNTINNKSFASDETLLKM